MLVYSSVISSRLKYIIDFFGRELFDSSLTITDDATKFKNASSPKINYGRIPMDENEFRICPVPLLSETKLNEPEFNFFDFFGHKAVFPTYGGDIPFDIFSAVFYFLSRYEEYLPHEKDQYGRYSHLNAIAYRDKFLDQPLVDIWIWHFRKALSKKYPSLALKHRQFSFQPTYDIDIAYSYAGKGRNRNVAGAFKSLLSLRFGAVVRRIEVLRGKAKDPFDAYDLMDEIHRTLKTKPRYFFLLAEKNKAYDKNILPDELILKTLVKSISAKYPVGIHPGWQSYNDPERIKREKKLLENISGLTVTHSRQHYIKMNLPDTYRQLIAAGITEDYSMGYGSINGFRASYSGSFYFYDLAREQQTKLLIHPFCFMDANAFYEEKLTPEKACADMYKYYELLVKYNGTMIMIWHNHFLGTDKMFAGWKEIYQEFVKKVTTGKKLGSLSVVQ